MKGTYRRFYNEMLLVLFLGMAVAGFAQQKAAAPAPKSAVPFIEDDYVRALADAQKRNVQLFVDLWAPW